MLAVHVEIHVKPEAVDRFIEVTIQNARNSLQEPGIVRFDMVQNRNDPSHFVLVEVYRDDEAPLRHKETAHYAAWRDAVADMMAAPRSSIKYTTVFPNHESGWRSA
jgi:(4S)-4-hydroxy-5-phosphonooxypentane-2,3-dione isomerase